MSQTHAIVVGIDGSQVSLDTVGWAAAEARLRGCPLRLVHAYTVPSFTSQPVLAPYDWAQIFERDAEVMLDEAREVARGQVPEVPLSSQVTMGGAAGVLIDMSRDAVLVAVGNRGAGGFPALRLGSVAWKVATHADSPVVIVPPGTSPTRPGPVVVGVDGSPQSRAALDFALTAASLRAVPLHAVYAWEPQPGLADDVSYDRAALEAAARDQLQQWLAPAREKFPHLTIELFLGTGRPAANLLERAGGASLLVVGSRGRGGFSRLLLGSVSHQVIQHAECPVAVLR